MGESKTDHNKTKAPIQINKNRNTNTKEANSQGLEYTGFKTGSLTGLKLAKSLAWLTNGSQRFDMPTP